MITVDRSIHIKGNSDTDEVSVSGVGYVSATENVLLESVSEDKDDTYLRRSEDNGKTWERCEDWLAHEVISDEMYLDRSLPDFFLHRATGWVFRVTNYSELNPNIIAWEGNSPIWTTRKTYLQISKDEGHTWSEPQQLILAGEEYDEVHWARDIWYGKNSAAVGGAHAVTACDGTILLPLWMIRVFANDTLASPVDGIIKLQCACLRGTWHVDGRGIDWELGDYVTLPSTLSVAGVDEGSFDFLPDGRLFMILRVASHEGSMVEIPSSKFFAVSDDDGQTWSEPKMLRYTDRGCVYSPGSLGNVFRSHKNGRFYLIANILDLPTYNCDPRYPLQIAEIDPESLRVIRDSVTVIEDREGNQPEYIRFSNFRWYEDRETGDIVLFMTHDAGATGRSPGCGLDPHSYRYNIQLPEK